MPDDVAWTPVGDVKGPLAESFAKSASAAQILVLKTLKDKKKK